MRENNCFKPKHRQTMIPLIFLYLDSQVISFPLPTLISCVYIGTGV